MFGLSSSIGLGELLAVGASVFYSVTLISVRQGLRSGTPLVSVLTINLVVSTFGFVVSLLKGTLLTAPLSSILWFMGAGALGQGMGQLFFSIGIERMGVSRASPIQSSTPIWAVFFAAFFLGERPGTAVWLGTFAIVAGVAVLSLEGQNGGREEAFSWRGWLTGAIAFPLASSILYAIVPIFMKLAYVRHPAPFAGIAFAFGAGTLIVLATRPLQPSRGRIRADRRALLWFLFASSCTAMAAAFFWSALSFAEVSAILPLSRLVPLWVVLWSYFFLGSLERITARVAFAAGMVVAGGIMVTVFQ